MGSLRLVAVSALALACFAGCSEDRGETVDAGAKLRPVPRHAAPAPTASELRWIGELERWYEDQYAFSTLADCSETLEREVGQAPTRRLGGFRTGAVRACALFERANEHERQALARSNAALAEQASREFRAAEREMTLVKRNLDAYRPNHGRRLPKITGPSARSRVDVDLTRLAVAILGRRAEIRCWSDRDWNRLSTAMNVGAFAGSGGFRAHLAAADCNRILRFWRSTRHPRVPRGQFERLQLAYSITTFSHELGHLAGNFDEAVTECYAMQEGQDVVGRLGASRADARTLAKTYWDGIYRLNPPEYRSSECRDGGQLDLRPGTSVWP